MNNAEPTIFRRATRWATNSWPGPRLEWSTTRSADPVACAWLGACGWMWSFASWGWQSIQSAPDSWVPEIAAAARGEVRG